MKSLPWKILYCGFLGFLSAGIIATATAGVYKYKDENGVWHFTDSPTDLQDPQTEQIISDRPSHAQGTDLQKQVMENAPPRNDIEKARNATVSIKTPLNTGSGFFISNDGYIVTCKHVVDDSEEKLNETENRLEKEQAMLDVLKEKLAEEEKWLETEEQWLQEAEEELGDVRRKTESGEKSLSPSEASYYNAYIAQYTTRSGIYIKRRDELNRVKQIVAQKEGQHREQYSRFDQLNFKRLYQRGLSVTLADRSTFEVTRVAVSSNYDLALLRLEGYKTPSITAGSIVEIAQGEPLYAIGSPLSLDQTVTSGIFSGSRQGLIQTNAQINPGNSGGPLVTEKGAVIGVNTMKIAHEQVEGIGFAIPIQVVFQEFSEYLR